MERKLMRFWPHNQTCCGRSPIVGARYSRMRTDLITGKDMHEETYIVVLVEPIKHHIILCRRVHLKCERTGKIFRPQVAAFWADTKYRAIDNVVALPNPPAVR